MEEQEKISQETEIEKRNTEGNQSETSKRQKEMPLDTETTIADMNVEGFSWYNPRKKKGKSEKISVTRKEYWAMVKGAFAAMMPLIICGIAAMGIVFVLAYLWLKP